MMHARPNADQHRIPSNRLYMMTNNFGKIKTWRLIPVVWGNERMSSQRNIINLGGCPPCNNYCGTAYLQRTQ
jgi:hypothetical protein